MANGTFTITLVSEDGTEKTMKNIKVGQLVSSIVGSGSGCVINGVTTNHDAELRANDRVEAIRKSAKGAKGAC